MELFQMMLIGAVVFNFLAALLLYRSRKDFKKLNIGDMISDELREVLMKRIRIAIILIVIGTLLGTVGTIMS